MMCLRQVFLSSCISQVSLTQQDFPLKNKSYFLQGENPVEPPQGANKQLSVQVYVESFPVGEDLLFSS